MMAAASSFFYPRDVERFLENLDFHGLAAEQALQFAHPSFQLTDTARADDIFVSLDSLQAVGQRRRRWTDVITSTRGGEAF